MVVETDAKRLVQSGSETGLMEPTCSKAAQTPLNNDVTKKITGEPSKKHDLEPQINCQEEVGLKQLGQDDILSVLFQSQMKSQKSFNENQKILIQLLDRIKVLENEKCGCKTACSTSSTSSQVCEINDEIYKRKENKTSQEPTQTNEAYTNTEEEEETLVPFESKPIEPKLDSIMTMSSLNESFSSCSEPTSSNSMGQFNCPLESLESVVSKPEESVYEPKTIVDEEIDVTLIDSITSTKSREESSEWVDMGQELTEPIQKFNLDSGMGDDLKAQMHTAVIKAEVPKQAVTAEQVQGFTMDSGYGDSFRMGLDIAIQDLVSKVSGKSKPAIIQESEYAPEPRAALEIEFIKKEEERAQRISHEAEARGRKIEEEAAMRVKNMFIPEGSRKRFVV